jgi:hypothetical protein
MKGGRQRHRAVAERAADSGVVGVRSEEELMEQLNYNLL